MEKEKRNLYDFLKIIYDIIEQIYKNKESHRKNLKKKEYGFLVKKKDFDEFKKYIYYKDLEKYVKDKTVFGNFRQSINAMKKYIKFHRLQKQISFIKFENSQELINDLLANHNEYYIINTIFGKNIMHLQMKYLEKEREKEIEYKITKKHIFIYFKNNDYATFIINKDILIGESNLIKQNENLEDNQVEELNIKENKYNI